MERREEREDRERERERERGERERHPQTERVVFTTISQPTKSKVHNKNKYSIMYGIIHTHTHSCVSE